MIEFYKQVNKMRWCCILAFDPAKNAIPRWCTGRRWHILMAVMRGNRVGGYWLMKWDEVKKIPMVESDLWTAWQLFPLDDDPTWDSKNRVGDWVDVELLYNSVKTKIRQFELQLEIERSYRWDVVRKATPGQRGSGPPSELGSREDADKIQ